MWFSFAYEPQKCQRRVRRTYSNSRITILPCIKIINTLHGFLYEVRINIKFMSLSELHKSSKDTHSSQVLCTLCFKTYILLSIIKICEVLCRKTQLHKRNPHIDISDVRFSSLTCVMRSVRLVQLSEPVAIRFDGSNSQFDTNLFK